MPIIRRILTEPLLHFVLLGAVLFAAFNILAREPAGAQETIVVSQARIENLAAKFTRTWQRPPGAAELNGLIQDYIREEAAVREALALGIDRNDTVIRRLLRQRLEFVTEDVAALTEPSEADLNGYLRDHAEDFRTETRISFSQIFFDPQRRGAALTADAGKLRARLNAAGGQVDVAMLGDATLLEHQFTALPLSAAVHLFGEDFAAALSTQKPGKWSAPIASAYGEHLVYVSDVTPGTVPELAQIRDTVRRELLNTRRKTALDAYYTALLQRYQVSIDMPPATPGHDQLAELR